MASFAIDVEDDTLIDQNKSSDGLQFQDIPHSEDKGKVQTHTFTNFPHTADSDDDAGDKSELLKDEKKPPSFWTFEYYQQFFDVDTHQVMYRVLGSMTPRPGRNFLTTQIRPKPDLYGPFWICTTLVFTTAIAGNLANYFQAAGKGYTWKYDFHKVTFAATAIFSYWWLIPAALFEILWWRGSQSRYTFLELISVYGYSLAIYIPISILWTIQINCVLIFTFCGLLSRSTGYNKRIAFAVMAVILIFHAALAAGFVLYFFHVPANTTGPSTLGPAVNNTAIPETQNRSKALPEAQQRKKQLNEASKLRPGPAALKGVPGAGSGTAAQRPSLKLPALPQNNPGDKQNEKVRSTKKAVEKKENVNENTNKPAAGPEKPVRRRKHLMQSN
ncbi:protein YIPF1-like [Haliotis rubra]|uniref:protein YIPF1-like n=1 Tax=Haliotis rubra TaxID=36100 RepID=UPI001EE523A2|nr:protein YIPF1-like [Haliotis rubra]